MCYSVRQKVLPKDSTVAVIFEFGLIKTAGVAAPANNTDPLGKGWLYFAANREALHTDKYGLSSMALLKSDSTTSSSKDNDIFKSFKLAGSGCQSPKTKPVDEQLSAITSSNENLKFLYLESIISMAVQHDWM